MGLKKAILLATAGLIIVCKGVALPNYPSTPDQSFGHDDDNVSNLFSALSPILSPSASISTNLSLALRWSDYHAPRAGYLVNVATEEDVAETIKFCNAYGLKFLAQNGGNGWADTWSLGENDVVINLRPLNSVVVSEDRRSLRIGGGVSNVELIETAYEAGAEVLSGGCDCVGVLGSTLGGGVSRWMNKYGLPADNLIAATVAIANGSLVHVSEDNHPDLLWALRGAGPNFGIVTSATMNAFPISSDESARASYWAGEIIFSGEKLEAFVEAMNELYLNENMTVHFGFSHSQDTGQPIINAEVFWMAPDAAAGREAFRSFYALEPEDETTQIVSHIHLNDDTAAFCEDGGRKPGWHTGLRTLDLAAFRAVWDLYVEFVDATGAVNTGVLVECYSSDAIRQPELREGASYDHRDINFYAMTIPIYDDPELDDAAEAYGQAVREVWRRSSGFDENRVYINFAHGDEPLEEIYGESLPRLRELKEGWDPEGMFSQWFPIV